MSRPYQITAAICVLFAAFVAYESVRLKFYTAMGPGPGFFPLWLSILFGVLAVLMFCQAAFGQSDPMPANFFASRSGYGRIGAILVALIGTVVLLNPLGFRLTALAFYLFLLNILSRHNLIISVLAALAGSFGVYHVFANILMLPLPVGILGI
jgi:putative tricarboxylic transport membrane protein